MTKHAPEKWLILSHAFNMDGRAASQTITDKLPHLRGLGIEPVVVSSVLGSQDAKFEHHQVWPIGGAGLRFDLRHVIRRYLGIGWTYKLCIMLATILLSPLIFLEKLLFGLDSQASWSVSAFLCGIYLIRKQKIHTVYSTGGAYSAHLAGYWLNKYLKVRWIAEIHDPMVSPLHGVTTRSAQFLAGLETRICNHADMAWWFTQGALESAQKRNPNASARMMDVLPGAEPPEVSRAGYKKTTKCVFGHFGTLTDSRSLQYFVLSFDAWAQKSPEAAALCEIHIYGSHLDAPSESIVKTKNMDAYIKRFGRLEYSDVLKMSGRQQVNWKMCSVDCLLLTHGDTNECAEYIPSKFYEYLWAQRPQLAMIHKNPQLEHLARERMFYVSPATDIVKITEQIEQVYQDWQSDHWPVAFDTKPVDVKSCVVQIVSQFQAGPV
jgi:hypothetical protein